MTALPATNVVTALAAQLDGGTLVISTSDDSAVRTWILPRTAVLTRIARRHAKGFRRGHRPTFDPLAYAGRNVVDAGSNEKLADHAVDLTPERWIEHPDRGRGSTPPFVRSRPGQGRRT